MRVRLRGPEGSSTLIIADEATVGDLVFKITEKTAISNFYVKYGYPPKPLPLEELDNAQLLSELEVKLDGEQLTISPKEPMEDDRKKNLISGRPQVDYAQVSSAPQSAPNGPSPGFVSIKKNKMEGEVPEIPLPDRGATMVLRVMPDDNSCLFRAFGLAVLPGDDQSMPELRSLVASAIQAESDIYTQVVLEQAPDDYCRWIQTPDAWGGAIELAILSKYFDIESMRIDKFNEGRPTRCILVYSGIHYDTIAQSPSDPPYLKAHNSPDFDQRVWDSHDNYILNKALELCQKLHARHYYTSTATLKIKCNVCGSIVFGEKKAAEHAQQSGHYDMTELPA
ncbi:hypothetical protein K3495_g1162 [Podosphaera aphanis]|nr:hypothetical protein K3495_g1162 [Podosphaera aphanis]